MSHQAIAAANKATFAGFTAVLMWALLALFTDMSGAVPPFQLAAMSFFIGTIVGLIWLLGRPKSQAETSVNPRILLAGGAGLFAYHALYFAALKNAPAVEASLIAYLWPLLIVVGSALLPGNALRLHHIAGALLGFLGTFFLIAGGTDLELKTEHSLGYALAFAAAFTWTSYSLASSRLPKVPTSAVIYYCAISTILSLVAHVTFEQFVMPEEWAQWLAIFGLGALPVGAAFYVWDYGMKHGNVQVIGASSYAAPLLSTIILIIFARADFTWSVVTACVLITLGAIIAARDMLFKRP